MSDFRIGTVTVKPGDIVLTASGGTGLLVRFTPTARA